MSRNKTSAENLETPKQVSSTSEAFRVPGFNEFLSKFADAEDLDLSEANREVVLERFEAFRSLPKVAAALKEVISEKLFKDLGIKPEAGDLKTIDAALEAKLFTERNFSYLEDLTVQIENYKQYPEQIEALEFELTALGSKEDLAREKEQLGADAQRQEAAVGWAQEFQKTTAGAGERVGQIRNMQKYSDEAEKFLLHQIDQVRKDSPKSEVLQEGEQTKGSNLEDLQTDLLVLRNIKKDLRNLLENPTDREALGWVAANLSDLISPEIKSNMESFVEGIKHLAFADNSGISQEQFSNAAEYSQKHFIKKLFVGFKSPERQAEKKLANEQERLHEMNTKHKEVTDRIQSISEADRELTQVRGRYDRAKQKVFFEMEVIKNVFDKVKTKSEQAINKKMQSASLEDVLAGEGMIDNMVRAKETDADLYGNIDNKDEQPAMHGGRTLKQLRSDFEIILTEKVSAAVAKALESLSDKQIDPDNLAVKLKSFEAGLGSLAKSEKYTKVRQRALENLAAKGSKLSGAKRIALRVMLDETKGGRFNLFDQQFAF